MRTNRLTDHLKWVRVLGRSAGRPVDDQPGRFFYRVTRRVPPEADFYKLAIDKYPVKPDDVTDEDYATWDAWSFYDSEEGARRIGTARTNLGNRIVRFKIPAGAGLTWDESDDDGHQNVRGDRDVLERYLDRTCVAAVKGDASPRS